MNKLEELPYWVAILERQEIFRNVANVRSHIFHFMNVTLLSKCRRYTQRK